MEWMWGGQRQWVSAAAVAETAVWALRHQTLLHLTGGWGAVATELLRRPCARAGCSQRGSCRTGAVCLRLCPPRGLIETINKHRKCAGFEFMCVSVSLRIHAYHERRSHRQHQPDSLVLQWCRHLSVHVRWVCLYVRMRVHVRVCACASA